MSLANYNIKVLTDVKYATKDPDTGNIRYQFEVRDHHRDEILDRLPVTPKKNKKKK
ncbi:hypothetical protein [Acholeplasma granularum]|uniref:hypothetical protein n=1 Tax=Acholeplasma granularum TaxID=264635 RepID=UPI0004B9E78B|nr:hypothetical protein [Acholeplasma granularum]